MGSEARGNGWLGAAGASGSTRADQGPVGPPEWLLTLVAKSRAETEGVAEPLIVSCCWNWRIRPATGSSARRYGGCHGPILTLQFLLGD